MVESGGARGNALPPQGLIISFLREGALIDFNLSKKALPLNTIALAIKFQHVNPNSFLDLETQKIHF